MKKLSLVVAVIVLCTMLGVAVSQATVFYGDWGLIYGRVTGEKAVVKVDGVGPVEWVEQYRVEPGGQLEFVRRIMMADRQAIFNPYQGDRFQIGYGQDNYLFISPEWAVQKFRKVKLQGVSVSRDKMCPDCGLALQLNDCARVGGVTVQTEVEAPPPAPKQHVVVQTPAPAPAPQVAAPAPAPAPRRYASKGPEKCNDCEKEIRRDVKDVKVIVTNIDESVGRPSPNDKPGQRTLHEKASKNLEVSERIESKQDVANKQVGEIHDKLIVQPSAAHPANSPLPAVPPLPYYVNWAVIFGILILAAVIGLVIWLIRGRR